MAPFHARAALAAALLMYFSSAASQTEEVPRISSGWHGNVQPPMLNGRKVQVYYAPASSGSNEKAYFARPVFLPQWKQFSAEVERACTGAPEGAMKSVSLHAEFWSSRLAGEIETGLNALEAGTIGANQLQVYPHYTILVSTQPSADRNWMTSNVRWGYPTRDVDQAVSGGIKTDLPDGMGTEPTNHPIITDTCGELRRISRDRTAAAWMMTQRVESEANVYSASGSFAAEMREALDLGRGETQLGSLVVTSSGGAKSTMWNIPHVWSRSVVNQSNTLTQTDNRKRYVSMNLLQDAVRRVSKRGAVQAWLERAGSAGSPAAEAQISSLALMLATDERHIDIELIGERQFKIRMDQLERTLSPRDAEELLSAAPEVEATTLNKGKFEYEKVKVEAETSQNIKEKDHIQWKSTSSGWIPIEATVYLVDEAKLSAQSNFVVQQLSIDVTNAPIPRLLAMVPDVEPTNHMADEMDRRMGMLRALIQSPPKQVFQRPEGLWQLHAVRIGGKKKDVSCQIDQLAPDGISFTQVGGELTARPYTGLVIGSVMSSGFVPPDPEQAACAKLSDTFNQYCASDWKCTADYRASGCLVNSAWLAWYRERQRSAYLPESTTEICFSPTKTMQAKAGAR